MARSWVSRATTAAALLLLLPFAAAVSEQAGKASPPGMLELTDTTFIKSLKELPDDRWVLVEFYAHWCPHCQHFKPEYEKVAAFFYERGEQEPVVQVARLDCAEFHKTCTKFKVTGYPTMKLGLAADFAALALDKTTTVAAASRHADSVVAFVGKHLNVEFNTDGLSNGDGAAATGTLGRKGGIGGAALVQHAQETGAVASGTAAPLAQAKVDLNDVEGATIASWQYLAASPQLLKGPEARQALKDWVDQLADGHPVERCRQGAEKLQEALDELWEDDQDEPEKGLQQLQICPGTPFKEWQSCRGTLPDSRGYTCGLWQLFHSLASRLPETENAGAVWLAAVKGFVQNYFQCTECAKHFVRHAAGELAAGVARKRDAVLWLWRTHNIVNRRLRAEDREDPSKADPASQHAQFPPAELCSKCRKGEGVGDTKDEEIPWDEEEVYRFLLDFYSGKAPAAAAASSGGGGGGSGGGGSRPSGWTDAGLLLCVVAACVYGVLRQSGQYSIRKSSSRLL
ncbi:hypothetical protein ABPG77_011525 [Micractinium sp. CCAP 211/92]